MSARDRQKWAAMLEANPELKAAWETFDRLTAETLAMLVAGQEIDAATSAELTKATHAVMNAANRGRAANDWT